MTVALLAIKRKLLIVCSIRIGSFLRTYVIDYSFTQEFVLSKSQNLKKSSKKAKYLSVKKKIAKNWSYQKFYMFLQSCYTIITIAFFDSFGNILFFNTIKHLPLMNATALE